jgi:AsmA protein
VKRKRIWFLAAFLLLAAALLALGIGFDSEVLRERLIAEVKAQTGRNLSIDDPLRLRLFPRLAVEIRAARLSEADAPDRDFLTLDELTGALKIMPLLQGKVLINRIEIRGLRVHARRYADGRTNFDDLLALKSAGESSWSVDVEKAVLLNGLLAWQDEMSGRHLEIREIYLGTGHLGQQARGKLNMGGRLVMEPEGVQMSLMLESLYWINSAHKSLQLDNPRFTLKGLGDGSEQLRVELAARQLRGTAQPASLGLDRLTLRGETDGQDMRLTTEITLEEMDWHSGQGGQLRQLTAQLTHTSHAAPFSLHLQMETMQGSANAWQSERLALTTRGVWEEHEFQGELATPLYIGSEAGASLRVRAAKLEGEALANPGSRLAQPLRLKLQGNLEADLNTRQAQGAFDLGLDDSTLAVIWQLEQLDPLQLRLQAKLDRLNLDRYLKPNPAEAGTKDGKSAPPPLDKTVSPSPASGQDMEQRMELEGSLQIGALQFNGAKLENLTGRLRMRQGKLEIQPFPEKTSPVRKKAGAKKGKQR